MISNRAMGAFKLALALVIAAWASMSLGWDDPKWALFAVSFAFLGTGGETLAKGLMRILGTIIGAVLALTFLALFAQDRFSYAAAVACWLFVCGWFLSGNSRIWYTWFVGGFTVVLLTEYSHLDSGTAFQVVMLRLQQTLLGITVYTLVESFIFPNPALIGFKDDLRRQLGHIRTAFPYLITAYKEVPNHKLNNERARELRHAAIQLQNMLTPRLDGATIESFDMLERRNAWYRAVKEMGALIDAIASWRLGFDDLQDQDGNPPLPNLDTVFDEISRRLAETEALLSGATTMEGPREVSVPGRRPLDEGDDVLARGALDLSLDALAEIERATRVLLLAVGEGQGIAVEERLPKPEKSRLPPTCLPDPERLVIALRVSVNFLCGFSVFIFVPNFPAVTMILILSTNTVLFLSRAPATSVRIVSIIGMIMITFGAVLHIFVMPHLTSFWGLGAILFVAGFALTYTFSEPRLVAARSLGLGMTIILMQLDNHQTFDFLYAMDLATAFLFPFGILWLTATLPVSFRPEHAFSRLLRRYLRAFQAVLENLPRRPGEKQGWWQRQIMGYHLRRLNDIPPRLAQWLNAIPATHLPPEGRDNAESFLEALQGLSFRVTYLMTARQADLREEDIRLLTPELTEWRDGIIQICKRLHDAPETIWAARDEGQTPAGRKGADAALAPPDVSQVTSIVHRLLERYDGDTAGKESRDMLRELAALRGVSEAVADILRSASAIDWNRLNEARL